MRSQNIITYYMTNDMNEPVINKRTHVLGKLVYLIKETRSSLPQLQTYFEQYIKSEAMPKHTWHRQHISVLVIKIQHVYRVQTI